MKIISFSGGLGNQIFEYAFYRYMAERYKNVKCVYRGLKEHNGLELNKYFDVCLPVPNPFYEMFAAFLGGLKKFLPALKLVDTTAGCLCENEDAIYIYGYKPDKKYMNALVGNMKFKVGELNEKNQKLIQSINDQKTVAIHVRRGDYLSPRYAGRYVDLTSTNYYSKALSIIREKLGDVNFLIFSDDISWCKEYFKLDNLTFVDWNTGKDSFLDMYLMSECHAVVTANSTFSYFGGLLGRTGKIVIYPDKWYKCKKTPNIFMDSWNCVSFD